MRFSQLPQSLGLMRSRFDESDFGEPRECDLTYRVFGPRLIGRVIKDHIAREIAFGITH